jgi:hypothetical protein
MGDGFPTFTVAQLAQFSGRPLQSYTPYADQALIQAVVIFMLVTQVESWPTDALSQQIATLGILQYADVLVLEQPFQQVTHNPFQSQTIGSTSYSKPTAYMRGNAQANALKGEATGIPFFDYAVQKLALRTEFGGIYGFSLELEMGRGDGDVWVRVDHKTGEIKLVGPAERDRELGIFAGGDMNAENWPAQENPGSGGGGMWS